MYEKGPQNIQFMSPRFDRYMEMKPKRKRLFLLLIEPQSSNPGILLTRRSPYISFKVVRTMQLHREKEA
jgi:hypothetical protein